MNKIVSMRLDLNNIYIYIYCRDNGPNSYIRHWALPEDVEWSEEGQIVIRGSNLKSHE